MGDLSPSVATAKTRQPWRNVMGPIVGATIIVALVFAPHLGLAVYQMSLVIEVLLFAIFAMSLDLLLGYTGMVSLGHAAFFAFGAYGAGLAARYVSSDILISATVGIAAAVILSVVIGWLSIRLSGFYFLMITFAFAEMVYSIADRWNWLTGGSNGFIVAGPTLLGNPVLVSRVAVYDTVIGVFVICFALMKMIVSSPFGEVLVGIRQNPTRMRALGYNVQLYKLTIFMIGAFFAAVAGVFYAQFNLFVSSDVAHWTQSADVLVMVLIGGSGTLIGPVIGAAVIILLQNWLSSYTEYWSLVIGILFIVLISGARQGILGLLNQVRARLWRGEA